MNPSAYQDALDRLYGRINYERTTPQRPGAFKLERMHRLLSKLGDPHRSIPAVHVAGTKGKGSTSVMLTSILRAAGYRVGLFTSPHLECLEERISVEGDRCDRDVLVELTDLVWPAVQRADWEAEREGESGPTFFEITTAMAMLYFAKEPVDLAVLEVGLGGRLDSTNVCFPITSVITNISFDHMRQLGSTLAEIAREKAGIIKPGSPVVHGAVDPEPRGVIEQIAAERGCRLFALGREFEFSTGDVATRSLASSRLDFHDHASELRLENIELGVCGAHQATNAAISLATIARLPALGFPVEEAALRAGLRNAKLPGRVEVLGESPTVVLDTAHNVASVQALLASLNQLHPEPTQRTLVYATSDDKDVRGMLKLLTRSFDRIFLTKFQSNPRAADPQTLAESVAPTCEIVMEPDPVAAWRGALADSPSDGLLCVTGSFFLAAELRAEIRARLETPSER